MRKLFVNWYFYIVFIWLIAITSIVYVVLVTPNMEKGTHMRHHSFEAVTIKERCYVIYPVDEKGVALDYRIKDMVETGEYNIWVLAAAKNGIISSCNRDVLEKE